MAAQWSKVLQNASLRAFCNTFDLQKVIIGFENQFLVFLRVVVLHRFYCILPLALTDVIGRHVICTLHNVSFTFFCIHCVGHHSELFISYITTNHLVLVHHTELLTTYLAGPRSAVGNVSGYRCVSDCRSRGREFDPGPVPYFRGD